MMAETANEWSGAVRYAFSKGVVRRNVILAMVVGCLLTLANQFDVLFSQPLTARLGAKMLLNFLIPFAVSSTSAAMNRQASSR